jgi:DNA-directed RNA polymerase beta' subunit
MVIQEPEPELEPEIPLVPGFFWFFTEDDLIVDPLNANKLTVKFNIDSPMWLPATVTEAYRWYMYSPNAAPLRSKSELLTICKVSNMVYEGSRGHLNEEPKPDDWLYTEMIDISSDMPLEPEYDGYVVNGPISSTFKIGQVKQNYELHKAVKQIGAIYSNMMSPNEIKRLSADRVIRHTEVYEVPKQSKTATLEIPRPLHGGVADLRLGTYDTTPCYTCGHTGNKKLDKPYACPGHFGRINLAVPVPNYLYLTGDIDSSPLVKTLKYTCRSCHKVVLPDEVLAPLIEYAKIIMYESKNTSPDGFALIWKALNDAYNHYYKEAKRDLGPYQIKMGGPVKTPLSTRVNHCPHCDEKSPILLFKMKFGMGKQAQFFPKPGDRPKDEFPRKKTYPYWQVYDSLMEVPNDHALVMGYNTKLDPHTEEPRSHPGYLFWQYFPISPNQSRPPIETPGGGLDMNDVSKLYINIVRANQKQLDLIATDPSRADRMESSLFKACTQALSSQTSFGSPAAVKKFSGSKVVTELLEGVYDRIKPPGEKKNHIRAINQSKVTEHTLYSVITPDPGLRIDEIGIPITACIRMTVAERVTKKNIERLREAIIRGYPLEEKGILSLDSIDIKQHFGGAKYIQKVRPGKPKRDLEEKPDSKQDPFAETDRVGSEGRYRGTQMDEEAQTRWYQEILNPLRAAYPKPAPIPPGHARGPSPLQTAIDIARREFVNTYAREKRQEQADSLNINDIVHRCLVKGDIILFTRAPALHRQNIMAGKVIPLDQKSISFNPTICVPFNADYDGDTMRCYVPQSPEAIQEAKDLLDVNKQIIHSRYGRPIIASDQDETSGAYLLTFPNKSKLVYNGKDDEENDIQISYNTYQKLDDEEKETFKGPYGTFDGKIGYDKDGHVYFAKKTLTEMLGLVYTRDDEGNIKYVTELPEPDYEEKYYTGKSVVSMFIPEGINCDWKDETGEPVSIRDGKLLYGTLDGKGVKNGSMVLGAAFVYHFNYALGMRKLAEFIDHINRLFFAAHLYVGYTIGITDISFADRGGYRHKDTGEEITLGELERLIREEKSEGYEYYNAPNEDKKQLYDKANDEIELITAAFFNRSLEGLPDKYFEQRSRHWITYDPLGWTELAVADITKEFDDSIIELAKKEQGTANAMNIAVVSRARASDGNIQQMSGAYGQVTVGGNRLISGIQIGRLLPHFKPGDYSGTAFGFAKNSYADGLAPEEYFMASIAGRRSTMESSMGAIQKSGYLEHRLKRASENLMIDERGYLVNLRLGKVLSLEIGNDGLQPFHARGPDNPGGFSLSLQSHFISHRCNHGITLHDECDTCQMGTPIGKSQKLGRLPKNISSKLTEKLVLREIAEPTAYFARAYEYYTESKAQPGEMIGSTGAANVGEPVTQAGLRAFHGGGKGAVPTTDRIVQLLDLSKSAIKQPVTSFFLKEEYNTKEDAQKIANFCSSLLLRDITKIVRYQPVLRAIDIIFDQSVVATFQVDLSFVQEYLAFKGNNENPKYTVEEIEGGLRVAFLKSPLEMDIDSYLLLMKESLSVYQIHGLVNGGRAFADETIHPIETKKRWCVQVNGPFEPKPGKENPMMENAYELIGEYYDEYLTVTNDPFWIAHEYGLEASLENIKDTFYQQMNTPNGLGELDIRYIDALIDNMGSTGYLTGLGKSGHMVSTSTSLIGGIGGEDPGKSLRAHPIMGSEDRLEGMVEAVTAGKTLNIGKHYRDKKASSE